MGTGLGAALRAYRQRRAAIRELEALDDRVLNDIGICRADIPAAVADRARRAA